MRENETFKDGNTTITIIYPKITPEENQKRWEEVNRVASTIVQNMISRGEI